VQVPTHPNAVVALHRDLKNVVQLQPIELTIHHDQQWVATVAKPMRLVEIRVGAMQSIHRSQVLKALRPCLAPALGDASPASQIPQTLERV
jgi:hypothetical protein